ncbi:DUF4129 domain-containing protein [Streptomyces sp. CB03238]|uniref:DUF4129 domain-containing protein n=1 Tax=Streptomyces sp. CB03238 TaxID=1907777 RepID=UPI000A1115E6|nr:DUF4129 domain-containing protein [Streptomyces sp. CB03238]ORT53704.1 hypothetical protein BKD26_37520 [Streptomyces sp. CB03238]
MPTTGGLTTAWPTVHANDDVPLDTPRVPAREAAERELSKPMYHENDPNLLQRALDSFWDWVGRLFDSASGAAPGGLLGLVAIALIVLALVGALWWRLGTPQRTPVTADSLFDDRPRSATEHRTAAEEHAAAGRWNQAVQERMRAIVRSLEERTLLDPRPGRTADEAAAEAGRPLPAHADELRAAARAFDDVTYGGRTADQRTYQRLKDVDTALERAKPHLSNAAQGAA